MKKFDLVQSRYGTNGKLLIGVIVSDIFEMHVQSHDACGCDPALNPGVDLLDGEKTFDRKFDAVMVYVLAHQGNKQSYTNHMFAVSNLQKYDPYPSSAAFDFATIHLYQAKSLMRLAAQLGNLSSEKETLYAQGVA